MFQHEQVAIQATQYIINLLENSKLQSEESLDSLPGIYTVIDSQGQILKGNKSLASIFEMNYEQLLGLNLNQIFSQTNWQTFKTNIEDIQRKKILNSKFKIDIYKKDNSVRNYLWYVNCLTSNHPNSPILFSVLGHDVTDLTRATEENSRMQFELKTAKLVQNTFFPQPSAKFDKASIASHFESASECGGDWWYYQKVNDKLFLWIGDVTGHGVSAALVVSAVHSVVSIMEMEEMTPSQTLSILNLAVSSMSSNPLVMTFLIASIDLKTRECIYASAAHEPIIVLSHNKKKFKIHDLQLLQGQASLPLGTQKMLNYEESRVQLQPGDRLLFYTDGVYDVVSPNAGQWNRATFYRSLARQASQSKGTDDLVSGLHKTIDHFRQGLPLRDDITFFCVQV